MFLYTKEDVVLKLAVCLSLTIVNDFLLKALDANWLVLWYGSNVTPKLIRKILFVAVGLFCEMERKIENKLLSEMPV